MQATLETEGDGGENKHLTTQNSARAAKSSGGNKTQHVGKVHHTAIHNLRTLYAEWYSCKHIYGLLAHRHRAPTQTQCCCTHCHSCSQACFTCSPPVSAYSWTGSALEVGMAQWAWNTGLQGPAKPWCYLTRVWLAESMVVSVLSPRKGTSGMVPNFCLERSEEERRRRITERRSSCCMASRDMLVLGIAEPQPCPGSLWAWHGSSHPPELSGCW